MAREMRRWPILSHRGGRAVGVNISHIYGKCYHILLRPRKQKNGAKERAAPPKTKDEKRRTLSIAAISFFSQVSLLLSLLLLVLSVE